MPESSAHSGILGKAIFIGIIAAVLLTLCAVSVSDDSDAATSYNVRVFIGDGTEDGTMEFGGSGSTLKDVLTNAVTSNYHSITFDYKGYVTKLDDIESTDDKPLHIYKWTPIKGWIRTQANVLGNQTLEEGTSYYIYQSNKTNNFDTGLIDYPGPKNFKPVATGYFYIKMVEDLNANDHVKSVLTEEQRTTGFWISGQGSDMAEAFNDACQKLRDSGNNGFELVINLTDGSDYKGWLGSFMGLGDVKLNAEEYKYWSQFNWDYTKSQWVYSECLGHYDPGVMPYSCIVRQITKEGSADAISCPTPSEIPKALTEGSSLKVSFVGYNGEIASQTEVPYFSSVPEYTIDDVGLSNGDTVRFKGWNVSSADRVLTDMRIEPLFEYELNSGISADTVSLDLSGSFYTALSQSSVSSLKTAGVPAEIKVKGGSVSLNAAAVSSLEDRAYSIAISKTTADVLSDTLANELTSAEIFDVDFGDQHSFGDGTLTISIDYNVPDGKNSSDMVVYHIENGEKSQVQSKYSDGRITFDVAGLSYFAVTYNSVDDGDSSILIYAVIAILIVAVLGAVIVVKKHKT